MTMKLCINCKHFSRKLEFCHSPSTGISPVDGRSKGRIASIERGDFPLLFGPTCGPDGVNFEPAPKPYLDPVDYSKTETVSPSGFVYTVHQYYAKWRKA